MSVLELNEDDIDSSVVLDLDKDKVVKRMRSQRRYLPTLADLIDRLSIVQLKCVFIPEHKEEYLRERADIEHDIDLILENRRLNAANVHAILVLMFANRVIWENEAFIRKGLLAGVPIEEIAQRLKLTHSINGVRATAKNELSDADGGRKDYKADCLAADLPPEFGQWNIFE